MQIKGQKFNSVNETVPNDLVIIKELFEPPQKKTYPVCLFP